MLQQEKPEVDLEKEIIRYQREDMDRDTTVRDVARHFYELGQQNRPKISDTSLEEEIERYEEEIHGYDSVSSDDCKNIARHFSRWGEGCIKK